MEGSRIKASTIDGYIALYPSTVQDIMQELRRIVHDVAPDVTEAISYAIPAFKRAGGNLVFFAGYDRHIGVYPVPTGDADFQQIISGYKQGKGSIQFPLDKPFPFDLFRQLVAFRLAESHAKKKPRN